MTCYNWNLHNRIVKRWKEEFWAVYDAIKGEKYVIQVPLHAKIRIKPFVFREYRIDSIEACKGLADEYINFTLINEINGEIVSIQVYPAFELKSESKIVKEDVIFDMLAEELKEKIIKNNRFNIF